MTRIIALLIAVIMLFSLAACTGSEDPSQTSSSTTEPATTEPEEKPSLIISVDSDKTSLYAKETLQLTAKNALDNSPAEAVVWSVLSGEENGSVDESGIFTAKRPGDITIQAQSGDMTASITITVSPVEATYSYQLVGSSKQYHFYSITSTYLGEDHTFEIRVPIVPAYDYEPEEAAALMDKQINTLNQMANCEANVNIWLYIATCLEDFPMMGDIIPSDDLSSNLPYFTSQLDSKIWVGYLNPYDISERNELYFATDHHWNADGWYRAYNELLTAMGKKYDGFAPRVGERVATEAYYYGSIGRDQGANGAPLDQFVYYNFGLPTHTIEIQKDGKGKRLYASSVAFEENIPTYEQGKQKTSDQFDHYVNFYPILKTAEYPDNHTGRNMLFMGDSFSLGVQELIASHFDKSYFCYLDGTKDIFKNQDFVAYCQTYGITDVVILEQSTRILYDFYDYSGPALASFIVK